MREPVHLISGSKGMTAIKLIFEVIETLLKDYPASVSPHDWLTKDPDNLESSREWNIDSIQLASGVKG